MAEKSKSHPSRASLPVDSGRTVWARVRRPLLRGLHFVVLGGMMMGLFSLAAPAWAQETGVSVSGQVIDADDGRPLPGANVAVKQTTIGTSTDNEGNYQLTAPSPSDTLVFSFIGYQSREVPIAGRSTIDVELRSAVGELEGVVVVGYGTQRQTEVTGSIASVGGAQFENEPVTDISAALQGRASGVEVVRNGGSPARDASIRIRGTGTVNDASPLIVIDGVPAPEGSINDVDPEIIESVEVLKDASSAAIYGNRAANGVVLITTKRGGFGQDLTVSFSASAGMSSPVKTIDVLEAPELAELKRERYANDGLPVNAIWQVDSLQVQRTNWQDELLDRGSIQDYNLSVQGGSERSTYYVAGSYVTEEGMMKSSFFERYGLKINSDHRIGEVLQVRQNLLLSRTKANDLNTLSAQSGVLWSAIRFHPGLPVQWPGGSYSSSQVSGEFGDINNPIFTVDTEDENTKRNRLLGNVEAELDLVEGLSLKANVGLDYETSNYYNFDIIIDEQIRANSRNELNRNYSETYSILSELSLNYNSTFAGHSIDAFGAFSVQTFDTDVIGADRLDFTNEAVSQRVLSAGNTIAGASGTRSDDGLQSYIGRVNYSYQSKYLLTTSFRIDGSSRFAEENRWGYFPATSVGWRVSEERFFERLSPGVSNLKLTAGWGRSGNQSVARLQYLGLFGQESRYSIGGQRVTGVNLTRLPNPNITWEVAEMTNVGLDMGFYDNRLQARVEYFVKDTEDMLLAPPTVGSVGTAAQPDINVGSVRNQGLELQLSYERALGEVDLNVSGNASFIRNEVLSINEEFLASRRYGRPNQELARTFEGEPIATFYGWRTDGLYQNQGEIDADPYLANDPRRGDIQPGDVRFVDLNGDGSIDGDDRTIIGSPHPDVTYGFNIDAGYRSFDLTFFFVGAVGVDIFNADRMQGLDPTYPFNYYEETKNRWRGEGTSNSIPRMTTRRTNLNHRASDLWVEPGDFLRLKTLTLGYSMPQGLLSRVGARAVRFYVTGQNVFTITPYSGMDPELGYTDGNLQRNVDFAQYPQSRTWTIGTVVNI